MLLLLSQRVSTRTALRGALQFAKLHSSTQLAQAPVTHWPGAVAPAPTPSGPIDGVPGAWRRKPGARQTQVLVDRTLADSIANLRFACASPHGPPSPDALHRVLRHVATSEDLEVLTKAFSVARRAAMRCDAETASLLVDAAIRVGRPAFALDIFRRSSELRVFPTANSFEKLLRAIVTKTPAANSNVGELLSAITQTMWLSRLPQAAAVRLGGLVTAAHAVVGDLPTALKAYADYRKTLLAARATQAEATRIGQPDARPLLHLLRALQAGIISADVLAAHASGVRSLIADTRADCIGRPGVLAAAAEAEALLPPAHPVAASDPAASSPIDTPDKM